MSADLEQVLSTIADTQADLNKLPPEIQAAVGHDDFVFLLIVSVRNVQAALAILSEHILVGELRQILELAAQLPGLIYKRFPIDTAQMLKLRLKSCGTEVLFLRPDRLRVENGRLVLGG